MSASVEPATPSGPLSIGDLAEATGIAPDTIRVWERRYGRPRPVRLPSGHRRYDPADVRWLRRVAEAIALGHRPALVVRATDRELNRLLEATGGDAPTPDRTVSPLLDLVRATRRERLVEELERIARRRGPRGLLDACLAPLIAATGRAWADGTIDVRHEHFLSEVLEDLLRSMRHALPTPTRRATVVLATLPEELHGLGLQMAALVCVLRGVHAKILGTNTPVEEIVAAANEMSADAVGISVSLASGGIETDRTLARLRAALPQDVALWIGGLGARGVRRGPRGVVYVPSFDAFEERLDALRPRRRR